MPDRNQGQNRGDQKDRLKNPGTLSPDDEAEEVDRTPADADAQGAGRRKRQAAEQPLTDIDEGEDEEAEDDEDDADGIGARPGA